MAASEASVAWTAIVHQHRVDDSNRDGEHKQQDQAGE